MLFFVGKFVLLNLDFIKLLSKNFCTKIYIFITYKLYRNINFITKLCLIYLIKKHPLLLKAILALKAFSKRNSIDKKQFNK